MKDISITDKVLESKLENIML